ncbi:dual serine/threonine and tyrosine protein kinase [Patella vulgata]|uniref:dual serine/threonine and tyrosine protein kinase n=1 Tax=Patella vulgata TaxID=6465 RepID=UPI0021807179|nr:dual serine/threonine and tyrosine protein kinase [Patella vulgata]
MTSSLASELHKFCGHSQRLQEILEETKKCFGDINNSGQYNGTQIVMAELLKEEETEVLSLIEKPQTIVVLGQTPYAKSRLINELFSMQILPPLDNNIQYRMVKFKHGETQTVSLALPDDYDLVDNLEAYNGPWKTIPRQDLELYESRKDDIAKDSAVLEVSLNHPLLRFGTTLLMSSSKHETAEECLKGCVQDVTPVIIYGFVTEQLADKDIGELSDLAKVTNFQPVCFVRVPPPGSKTADIDPPDGAPDSPARPIHILNCNDETNFISDSSPCPSPSQTSRKLHDGRPGTASEQLVYLGYIHKSNSTDSLTKVSRKNLNQDYYEVESEYIEQFQAFVKKFATFTKHVLKSYLVNAATVLNNSHNRCLNMFILSAFDMARDILITPKKIEFAREKEEDLYKSLLQISVSKLEDIKSLISGTISSMRDELLSQAAEYDFIGVDIDDDGKIQTAKGLKICTGQIQELVLGRLNHNIAGKLISSVNLLRDSYTGTLTRCLESLETNENNSPEEAKTTDALKQTLNAAYQVEITVRSSSSLIKVLLERMKQLVRSMPWNAPPKIDEEWKMKVASEMLNSLSEARLAKSIAGQIKDRLHKSHEAFGAALKQLDQRHSGRLDKIEEQRIKLRKVHAPKVSKLALESTSLRDHVLFGMPQMGREIGRGQYGVVYACEKWAGRHPCAIKSVVPPDEKHWNDLALEFFYNKNIPDHERIVALRGSVIDYLYGGGTSPAVLLIMDRLQKDLYTAIQLGLDWSSRLQVTIDVVEGVRFLHGQGLVHRDVKLKNVLLDEKNRGKITDLGFCKPEAMMSGSIVGTPIHMAPELFSGHYDNSVDVYAFGILFWYVCSGHVRLPSNFEQCANKDQLWQSVKKGLRPEKLPTFDDECWLLMKACWENEPMRRPFLGDVEESLKGIFERFKKRPPSNIKNKESRKIDKNSQRNK